MNWKRFFGPLILLTVIFIVGWTVYGDNFLGVELTESNVTTTGQYWSYNSVTRKYVLTSAPAGGSDASSAVKGITKLSVNPTSASNPIAVGINDPTVNPTPTAAGNIPVSAVGSYTSIDGSDADVSKALFAVGAASAPAFRVLAATDIDELLDLDQLANVATMTEAVGDLLYVDTIGPVVWNRLAVGSNGDILTLAAGKPSWAPAGSGMSDASSAVKGVTKLSINPVSATNPIAVGINDITVNPTPTAVGNIPVDAGANTAYTFIDGSDADVSKALFATGAASAPAFRVLAATDIDELITVAQLSDVTVTGLADNDIFMRIGGVWVNAASAGDVTWTGSGNTLTSAITAGSVVVGDLAAALANRVNPSSATDGGVLYGDGTQSQYSAAGTTGQNFKSTGTGIPVWADAPMATVSGGYARVGGGTTLVFLPDVSNRVWCFETVWVEKTIPDAGPTAVTITGLTADTDYYAYSYDSDANGTADGWEVVTTAPTTQNGIQVKTGATSRTLIARCRANASGAITTFTEDTSTQNVCNRYNKRAYTLFKGDSTNTWTYQSTTVRAFNGDAANRVEYVSDATQAVDAVAYLRWVEAGSLSEGRIGIGSNSTTVNSAQIMHRTGGSTAKSQMQTARYFGVLTAGHYKITALESCDNATASVTFYGDDNTPTTMQTGIVAVVRN